MEKSNTTDYTNINAMKIEMDSKQMLYNTEEDTNIYLEDDKRLNRANVDMSKRTFLKDLREVIENSDVILEVLDARDPLSCKSIELEEIVRGQKDEKKIILILNKIDLIPRENAVEWQNYFFANFKLPTIIFKANTQNQQSNLSTANIYKKSIVDNKEFVEEVMSSNKSIGADKLLELLKNYCRLEGGGKRSISVGVVGFPNVGKSSIINSLKRGKVVGVSSTPGYTRGLQQISLDKDIRLIDCPGVVLSNRHDDMILHNVIRTEDVKDPLEIVSLILKKVSVNTVRDVYELGDVNWETTERFLYILGDKMGKYKKGGIIDFDKISRLVVKDWNDGKLKYFTLPPNSMREIEMDV